MSDNEEYSSDSDASEVGGDVVHKKMKKLLKGGDELDSDDDASKHDDLSVVDDEEDDDLDDDDSDFGETDTPGIPKIMNVGGEEDDNQYIDSLAMNYLGNDEDDDDDDDNDPSGYGYLQKFDENVRKNIIDTYHQELMQHNMDEVQTLSVAVRNELGVIVDPLHKTLPFMTKYEKSRLLGERAKQINAGAKPLVPFPETMIDGYLIALKELEQKKIPFIIKRPLPNGGCEYWRLQDLEIIV